VIDVVAEKSRLDHRIPPPKARLVAAARAVAAKQDARRRL
jgi:hypothetical protein